jgi:hypothetical protein
MQHHCDIVVLSAAGTSVLAEPIGDAWLLPRAVDRLRIRPTHAIGEFLTTLGGNFYAAMHGGACLTDGADVLESSMLVLPLGDAATPETQLRWIAVEPHAPRLLLSSQARALEECRHPPAARFAVAAGERDWLPAVQHWAASVLATELRARDFEQYRVPPDRIVMRLTDTSGRPVFFKALSRTARFEYSLAQALEQVPRTLGFDAARGWWLQEAVEGKALAESLTLQNAVNAAREMGRLQRRLQSAVPRLVEHGLPVLSWSAIRIEIERAFHEVRTLPTVDLAFLETRLSDACEWADASPIVSWIDLDADPRNLLIASDGRTVWIDLEMSCCGAAGTGFEAFLTRLETLEPTCREWADTLRDSFCEGWSDREMAKWLVPAADSRTAFLAAQFARRAATTRRQIAEGRLKASLVQLLAANLVRLDRQLRHGHEAGTATGLTWMR